MTKTEAALIIRLSNAKQWTTADGRHTWIAVSGTRELRAAESLVSHNLAELKAGELHFTRIRAIF